MNYSGIYNAEQVRGHRVCPVHGILGDGWPATDSVFFLPKCTEEGCAECISVHFYVEDVEVYFVTEEHDQEN